MRDGFDLSALSGALKTAWQAIARPEQLPPPGDWFGWLILARRGWGKTRTGAEWVRHLVETRHAGRIALVGPTAADARDVMVEGQSGILAISPDWNRPEYEPSKRRLTWPNGAIATCFSAEEPERLRGPQHDAAWCDELAAWSNRDATWDQLNFGLRLGRRPRVLVTTTPKPSALLKGLMARPDVVVTRGATADNAANLAPAFIETIIGRYAGTRLGRQELEAEILDDIEGALWSRAAIEASRIARDDLPPLTRIVVAIDPATTAGEGSDETGIIVAGLGEDGHGYNLEDLSGRYAPTEWAAKAIGAYHRHRADRIIGETNQGGEMVESVLRAVDPNVAYRGIHASRGKVARAEPVAALYEQGRVRHVGAFPALEDQMMSFAPGASKSPDRLDAMVYAVTELMLAAATTGVLEFYRRMVADMPAAEIAGPSYGYEFSAPGGRAVVRFVVPPGHTVMLMSGHAVAPDKDGIVSVPEDDARSLRALGWRTIDHEVAT